MTLLTYSRDYREFISFTAAAKPTQTQLSQCHDVPRIRLEDIKSSTYGEYCGKGIPLVVTGVPFQGSWSPEDIVQRYGHHSVTIEDCESGEVVQSTAGEYFSEFGKLPESSKRKTARKVKVRNRHIVLVKG